MGEIFLARLEGAAGFEKLFVIKRIIPHLANDNRFRAMLISEARVAANMSHANICQVYDLAESDRQLHIVMEYLEGVTLLAVLRKYSHSSASCRSASSPGSSTRSPRACTTPTSCAIAPASCWASSTATSARRTCS